MKRLPILLGILLLAILAFLPATQLLGQLVYCSGLPGCDPSGVGNASDPVDFLPVILDYLLFALPVYIEALGEIFLAIGGLYMLLNLGNSERIEKGKKIIMWSFIGIFTAIFIDEFVYTFLATERFDSPTGTAIGDVFAYGSGDLVINVLLAFFRILAGFFNVALIAAIIFNALRLVFARGADEEYNKAKTGLFWGAVGAVFLNVAGRLIGALLNFDLF